MMRFALVIMLLGVLLLNNCDALEETPAEKAHYEAVTESLFAAPVLSVIVFKDGKYRVYTKRSVDGYEFPTDSNGNWDTVDPNWPADVHAVERVIYRDDLEWIEALRIATAQLDK